MHTMAMSSYYVVTALSLASNPIWGLWYVTFTLLWLFGHSSHLQRVSGIWKCLGIQQPTSSKRYTGEDLIPRGCCLFFWPDTVCHVANEIRLTATVMTHMLFAQTSYAFVWIPARRMQGWLGCERMNGIDWLISTKFIKLQDAGLKNFKYLKGDFQDKTGPRCISPLQ